MKIFLLLYNMKVEFCTYKDDDMRNAYFRVNPYINHRVRISQTELKKQDFVQLIYLLIIFMYQTSNASLLLTV